MRRVPDREERLAGLFVVVGSTIVFEPVIWASQRWGTTVARDPAVTWDARWLVERPSAHPYLTDVVLHLGVVLRSGIVMLTVAFV